MKNEIKSFIKFINNLFTGKRDKEQIEIIRMNLKELEEEHERTRSIKAN